VRRSLVAGAAAVLALCNAACRRQALEPPDPCQAGGAARLELRDGQGALLLALRESGAGTLPTFVLCDGRGRQSGRLVRPASPPGALMIIDGDGAPAAGITRSPGDDPALTSARGRYRLHDERGLLRILDGQGVPVGQVGSQGDKAVVFDPGGRPLATAEPASSEPKEDRRAVRGTDGAVRFLVLGARSDRAAAAFALPGFPPAEQALVALLLDGGAEAAK
jgi:hypothetical protein